MGRHSSLSQPHGYREAGVLDGARILVARAPDRAGELVTALRDAGAEPILLPLIDFEVASDQHSLDVAFDALGAGAYAWLVISSVTAVQALEAKAAERGATLETWLPGSLQVATIGPATRRALQLRGIGVDLAPSAEQSGAGLAGIWPEGRTRVFLPQADIADPALRRGLEAKGASVQAVTAYRTVDYPADPARSLATLAVATGDRSAAPPPPTARRRTARRRADGSRGESRGRGRAAARRRRRLAQCRAAHPRRTRPPGRLPFRRDRTLNGGTGRSAGPDRSVHRRTTDSLGPSCRGHPVAGDNVRPRPAHARRRTPREGQTMSFPTHRPRRLRTTPAMRRLTAEHRLAAAELILPAFIREDLSEPRQITSMPGVQQHTT